MFKVLLKDVKLFLRHLFVANRAHVVVVAMIDESAVLVREPHLESLPSGLRREIGSHILRAARLVKNAGLSLHAEVLAKLVEPLDQRTVPRKGSKTDIIERLSETEDLQGQLLCQHGLSRLGGLFAHVAKKIVPTCRQR